MIDITIQRAQKKYIYLILQVKICCFAINGKRFNAAVQIGRILHYFFAQTNNLQAIPTKNG